MHLCCIQNDMATNNCVKCKKMLKFELVTRQKVQTVKEKTIISLPFLYETKNILANEQWNFYNIKPSKINKTSLVEKT